MPRTYRTLSLSLPPEAVGRLEERGLKEGKTAARVAAEAVLRDVSMSVHEVGPQPQQKGDASMFLYTCIVHEPRRGGMFSREQQTISLLDISRIRGGRVAVLEVFLAGHWIEIEGDFDQFRVLWETAKASAAGHPQFA